jgi:hypothetical protein
VVYQTTNVIFAMATAVKEGALRKKRRNRNGASFLNRDVWQDRRFVLTYTRLCYGLLSSAEFKDGIDMSNSTIVTPLEDIEMPHAFKVETGSDNIIISCPSDSERTEWMEAIRGVTLGSVTSTAVKRSSLGLAAMQAMTQGLTQAEILEREAQKLSQEGSSPPRKRGGSSAFDLCGDLPASLGSSGGRSRSLASPDASSADRFGGDSSLNPVKFTDVEMDREELWGLLQVNTHCCLKRFAPSETAFKTRYIWVNESSREFHWSKVPEDMSQSKHINIYEHVESVTLNGIPGIESPNFVITFYPTVPASMWSSISVMWTLKTPPTSIEICMDDPVLCSGFVGLINDLRVQTKENPILIAKAMKRDTI